MGRKASFRLGIIWPRLNRLIDNNVVLTASRLNSRALRLQAAVMRWATAMLGLMMTRAAIIPEGENTCQIGWPFY